MHNHGSLGHAWSGGGGHHYGLPEIWRLFESTWCTGWPVLLLRLKDENLLEAPDDSAFLHSLRLSCSRVTDCIRLITDDDSTPWVRRLHLVVVDLNRRRRVAARVRRQLSKLNVDDCAAQCWNNTFHPLEAKSGTLWAPICLKLCDGWHWHAVLHSLARTDEGSFLLVSWRLERG